MEFRERVNYIISALRVQNSALDTSPLSPIRILIDAVAEMGAQADVAIDRAYDWDISKKRGRDLDTFADNFGFQRLPAKHSSGFVTLTFSYNTTKDYVIPKGTKLTSIRRNAKGPYTYLTAETVGIPRYTAFQTIPIVAEFPGASYNARPGEIRTLDFKVEQLVNVINEDSVTGGKPSENDEEFRNRFRTTIFRSNLGNESWYRSIALRHPRVSSTQLIQPSQEVQEHLKIVDNAVQCQEDSLIFTYPETFSVYLPRTSMWLEENRDFITIVDNDTPLAPRVEFVGSAHQEGESVTVRYRYCSSKSRNNPRTNNMHYLDMYVMGNSPTTVTDLSTWPANQVFGSGSISGETHPDGVVGLPYYVFTRQPVMEVPKEVVVQGRNYFVNKDYILVKDKSVNSDSTRAKDILMWKTNLPAGEPTPTFHMPYFHESVVSEIQNTVDAPDMHTAVDDVLVHAANKISFDLDVVVEWERGVPNDEFLRRAIMEYFAQVPMGSKIRIGPLMRAMTQVSRLAAVFLGEKGITSNMVIRGKQAWKYDVPLPDGSVPILNELNITTTASNLYE
jgi:hypothetical protein